MNFKKLSVAGLAICMSVSFMLTSCKRNEEEAPYQNKENKYMSYTKGEQLAEGMDWPEGTMLPHMAKPAEVLDSVSISSLNASETVMFSYFQGMVNKKQPRVFLKPSNAGEGNETWTKNLDIELNLYAKADRYELIKKYKDEIAGIILYDKTKSQEYINLACTAASVKNAIPVDIKQLEVLTEAGLDFPVLEDLTSLEFKSRIDIYNYLYDTYWKDCTKRLLFSLSAATHKYYVRDMAAATGAAVVWLENRKEEEKAVFCKFLADMEPGKSMVTGWYTEERSGIGAAAEFGLSTVPSDYFENSTVYAGMDHTIVRQEVPNKPELENKIYIAIFLSDGDNVQYCQHAMYSRWIDKKRGQIPLNWTISPALVDFAPEILNYYYANATENDFFASGPSGLGYSLLIDELNSLEETEKTGEKVEIVNLKDAELMAKYAALTQTYLERSGLRIITVWDLINDMHMKGYEENTRYLYGLTYQNWEYLDRPIYFVNDRLPVSPNTPCYAMNSKEIVKTFSEKIEKWDGNSPLFLNAQGNVWEMTVTAMQTIVKELDKKAPGKIELLRGDHYFSLMNEANGKPFDLSISEKLTVTASSNNDNAKYIIDGNPTGDSIWEASEAGEQSVTFDFGGEYEINRYVMRHAGDNAKDVGLNTADYTVELSMDGTEWTEADKYVGNTVNVTDIDLEPTVAKFMRITITNAGSDNIARIADVEIYGSVK